MESRKLTALVVEDDSGVREYAASVLQQDGFLTLSACSAADALRLSRNRRQRIDVLVTDVDLGDGDGIELADQIGQQRAGLAVLAISGTWENFERARAKGHAFLAKPFEPAKLVEAVRRLLPAAIAAQAARNPRPGSGEGAKADCA